MFKKGTCRELQRELRRRHIFTKMNTESLYVCNLVKVGEMTFEYDPQTSGFLRLKIYFVNISFLFFTIQKNVSSATSTKTSVYCRKAAEMYSIGIQTKNSRHIAQTPS